MKTENDEWRTYAGALAEALAATVDALRHHAPNDVARDIGEAALAQACPADALAERRALEGCEAALRWCQTHLETLGPERWGPIDAALAALDAARAASCCGVAACAVQRGRWAQREGKA